MIDLPLPRGTMEGERPNDSTAESWAAWGSEGCASPSCGGGVAAIEALLGLRALLGLAPHVELIAPNRRFVYEPLAVAEPFGRRLDGRCGRSSRDRLAGRVQGTPDRGILI